MRWSAAAALVLVGCDSSQGWDPSNPPACDPRELAAGEVRARRLWCNGELVNGGDGKTGDWIVENAVARFVVRGDYAPLTRLHGAGGTLVDATGASGVDAVTEATPLFNGEWFESVQIEAWNEEGEVGLDLVGTLPDGSAASLTWSLRADEATLRWTGADGLLVVPTAGSQVFGAFVEASADALEPGEATVLGIDGAPADEGGWIRYAEVDALAVGTPEAVSASLWPAGTALSGSAEGASVEVLGEGDAPLLRLPVRDGSFAGLAPTSARAVRARSPGHAPGDPSLPGRDLSLTLGAEGVVRVRVADDQGRDMPATLWLDGEPWPLPAGGGDALVGPGTWDAWVSAGPAYEAEHLGDLTVEGVRSVEVVLPKVTDGALLAELGLLAWPDRSTRALPADQAYAAAARGVGYAVLTADDEVASASVEGHDTEWILASGGATVHSDSTGAVLGWPWSPNSRQPAHGVPDADLLDATTLIDYVEMDEGRVTLVEPSWLLVAGAPEAWGHAPHGVRLAGLDELDPWFDALDQWQLLAATGPMTWLVGATVQGASTVDADAAIVRDQTVAGNGPMIWLTVDGRGPGEVVDDLILHTVRLEVTAPTWMDLDEAALYTTGGVELARWSTRAEDGARLVQTWRGPLPKGWIVAAAWGSETTPPLLDEAPWAVTSPVWVGRP